MPVDTLFLLLPDSCSLSHAPHVTLRNYDLHLKCASKNHDDDDDDDDRKKKKLCLHFAYTWAIIGNFSICFSNVMQQWKYRRGEFIPRNKRSAWKREMKGDTGPPLVLDVMQEKTDIKNLLLLLLLLFLFSRLFEYRHKINRNAISAPFNSGGRSNSNKTFLLHSIVEGESCFFFLFFFFTLLLSSSSIPYE